MGRISRTDIGVLRHSHDSIPASSWIRFATNYAHRRFTVVDRSRPIGRVWADTQLKFIRLRSQTPFSCPPVDISNRAISLLTIV